MDYVPNTKIKINDGWSYFLKTRGEFTVKKLNKLIDEKVLEGQHNVVETC